MSKGKQIQIDESFFIGVMLLLNHVEPQITNPKMKEVASNLKSQIDAKIERQSRREVFTEYKTSLPDGNKREYFRREYLKKAGVNPDWIG